jgi:4a-hydroxytetrahydrobiopterin dehydratase
MSLWPKDNHGRMTKTFLFKNYRQSFAFVSQVAMLAERKNHHPEILFGYNQVTIFIISHDLKKITDRDIDLAEKIDTLLII